jgi:hypothetical protein
LQQLGDLGQSSMPIIRAGPLTTERRKLTSGNGKKARQHLHLDGIWDITKLLFLDLKKQEPETQQLHERKTNFVEALVKLINVPLHYGFALKRWCTSITIMIEKDPGNPRIERLRVIHHFEADYNLSLKLIWGSRMVH